MKQLRELRGKVEGRDVFVFGGILLTAVGAGMIYVPAALICAGIVLLLLGVFGIPSWP